MKAATTVLFGGYVALLLVAGAWGVVGARIDFPLLLHLPLDGLAPEAEANLLSQYRFLRAIELGFGLFALRFRKEIFTISAFNQLFLFTMAGGVIARLIGLVVDGRPTGVMFGFLGWEAVGVIVIWWRTRAVRQQGTT